MSLTTPSKIRELQSKLYRKAKNEFRVLSRGIRHFSDEVVFGDSESCGFEMSNGTLVRESSGEASRKAGCVMWPPELCGVQPTNPGVSVEPVKLDAT
jgi:hypothetical protein